MSKPSEVITWAAYEGELRAWVEVPVGEEELLRGQLLLATRLADKFINRDFKDEYGNDTLTGDTLELVKKGVFEWVRVYREERGFTVGVTSVKTGDLSETFGKAKGDAAGAAGMVAYEYWRPFRKWRLM